MTPADECPRGEGGSLGLTLEPLVVVDDAVYPIGQLEAGIFVIILWDSPQPGAGILTACTKVLSSTGVTGWVPTRYIRIISE